MDPAYWGSVSITAVYLSQWLGPILAASVLYVPLFGMPIARKMREEGRSPDISLKHFLWYYLGAFSLIQVFIVWVSGGSSLGRIFDVIYLFFLLGYFFILQPVVVKYEHRLEPLQRFSAAFCSLGGVLCRYYGGSFPVPEHGAPVPRSNIESLRNIGRAVRGRLIEKK